MSQQHFGYARFGKIDGFQWIERTGVFDQLNKPEEVDFLSKSLALRQEHIRIFPQEQILGITNIELNGHQYQFVTLYQYALDQYKRDGYVAVTLALKEIKVRPQDIMSCLEGLLEARIPETRNILLSSFAKKLVGWPVSFLHSANQSQTTAFVSIPQWDSCSWLLQAAREGLFAHYQWVFASDGEKTIKSIDSREIDVLRLSAPEKEQETYQLRSDPRVEAEEESLVYAFDIASQDYWQKSSDDSPQKPKSGFGLKSLRRFFGG